MDERGFTSHLVMVRPFQFYCNQETALDNIYQTQQNQKPAQINQRAISQFDCLTNKLRQKKIRVTVVQDPGTNKNPDSIFPNNWISFHSSNKAIIYPMCAENRRKQREIPLVKTLESEINSKIEIIHNYTQYQNQKLCLEGTGSMVLDRLNKIVYAVLSQRTNKKLVQKFCSDMGYTECSFRASQYSKQKKCNLPIYHTNVLMSVSRKFVIIALELIDDLQERQMVREFIEEKSKKEIIQLSAQQILNFAGNTLTVVNSQEQDYLIMSQTAQKSLNQKQRQTLNKWVKIISSNLCTIEKNGGGSARCMLAQVF